MITFHFYFLTRILTFNSKPCYFNQPNVWLFRKFTKNQTPFQNSELGRWQLISSKKILFNTSYVPNSNMATSAGVSVYCTSINKCQLSIYHYHYCSKCPSDIHLHVSWQEPKNITFGGFFKTGQKVKSKLPNIFISPQTLNHL